MEADVINSIISLARRSKVNKTKGHGQWAAREIRKLIKPAISWWVF